MWGWIGKSLDDTPPSDNVAPPLAHVHLLGRGLNFRSDRVACGGALSALLGCLLCKGCLRFFPLNTDPVVRRVVSPAATALRLFPRGNRQICGRPHRRRTGEYIRSYAACVRRAGSACIAIGLSGPRTTPPTLASRRVRCVLALLTPQALVPPIL